MARREVKLWVMIPLSFELALSRTRRLPSTIATPPLQTEIYVEVKVASVVGIVSVPVQDNL